MILDRIVDTRKGDIFLTKTEKMWTYPTDAGKKWITSTNPWPTKDEWTRGDIKLLGPTALVVWSKEDD